MPFTALGLTPALTAPLDRLGFAQPTPIQTQAIPLVLRGVDLLARAQTGTGKTAAFGLPMIDRLAAAGRTAGPRTPRGLVLVPTRELALQVQEALVAYAGPVRLSITAVFGGVPIGRQIQALRRGVDVVVATPGRLIDHLDQKTIDLSRVEVLVLDEADRMLDLGFLPPLKRIVRVLPRERQTLLFSATLSAEVTQLAAAFTRAPERVDVSDARIVPTTVTHHVYPVGEGQKGALLLHVLREAAGGRTLVFCKTKRGANRVGEQLGKAGIPAAVIHGNKSQGARTRALRDFQSSRAKVLVATDIAARGLDIVELPLVVNYDLPLVAVDYVHRVGRPGRAGAAGRAVSLVSGADRGLLRDIERLLPAPVERIAVAGFEAPRHTGDDAPARQRGRFRRPGARPASRPGVRQRRRLALAG
jgi:ATP-dependent RNA helicase RhlE